MRDYVSAKEVLMISFLKKGQMKWSAATTAKNFCWHLVCMIIWSVYSDSEFERHFVQLEVCSEFPPAPDRDEVALSDDAVAPSQRREPKYCKWSKQKLMSITSRTGLTQDDTGWIFCEINRFLVYFNYPSKHTAADSKKTRWWKF